MVSSSEEVLAIVEGSDSGSDISDDKKAAVDSWLVQKSEGDCLPIDKQDLLGNYIVSYVSAGKSQKGNPAGGNYRGRIGRLLFKTTGLYQHLLDEETENSQGRIEVINLVVGRLLTILELNVVLRGFARRLNTTEKQQVPLLGVNALEAEFESPRIMLRVGGLLSKIPLMPPSFISWMDNNFNLLFQIGPESSVVLDTPYADRLLRCGMGGRGSLFVFKRIQGKDDPEFSRSEIWRGLYSQKPLDAKSVSVPLSFAAAYLGIMGKRVVGIILSLLAVSLAYWKGGKYYF